MSSLEIKILHEFFTDTSSFTVTPFGNGHINNTYKVENRNGETWLLQKINSTVFQKPQIIIDNHTSLLQKYDIENEIAIPWLINEVSENFLIGNKEKGFWRVTNFFKNTTSIENVTKAEQAEEAGRAYGSFIKGCINCNLNDFEEPIPNFHNLQSRHDQFQDAIQQDIAKRSKDVKDIIEFFLDYHNELYQLQDEITGNRIPKRIVHNDTKINNLLFSGSKVISVIDLDTVGPGSILYDYGDALRTLANETDEDDPSFDNVKFSMKWFESFTKGFIKKTGAFLNNTEKELLWQAPFLMTYIMGIRFLSDYLNGDIYYKIKYSEHNLIRAKVQKALIENMLSKKETIKQTIETYLHNL